MTFNRRMLAFGAAAAAALMVGLAVRAQPAPAAGAAPAPPPPAPQVVKPLKPGIYMVVNGGGNATVRVTNDGIILVDTKNPGGTYYDDLMAQIRTVSDKPVKYVFNTHHHADHTGNNVKFEAAGVPVIAPESLKAVITTFTPNPSQVRPAPPTVTFATDYTVKLGGAEARAHHEGPGHTGGDSVIYFPDEKVVSFGDTFVAATPNCDYPGGGSLLGLSKTLARALTLDFDVAVPGHGNDPMTKAQVREFKTKLDTLIARAQAAIKAGTPKEGLIAAIKTDDLGWNLNVPNWTSPARLDPFYAEMSK